MKILIPAKTESTRCPYKNFILLPYVSKWLKNEGRHEDAVVIYDSQEMRILAEELGFTTFKEVNPCSGDHAAVRDCAVELGLESFVWLPLTQPLRSHNLINEIEQASCDKNLVVSAQWVSDRTLFDIDISGKFVIQSRERKGCMCQEKLMVDGAAYACKTSWLIRVTDNESFWSEPFGYVINHAPFLDIDTEEDLLKFRELLNIV